MKFNEVKDKSEKITFFLSYVEISKSRVLQLLKQEVNKLNNIQNLKESNLNLLKAIEERWFLKKGVTFFEGSKKDEKEIKAKNDSTIYFLVDPKKIDIYSKNMLKKIEEILSENVTPNDYIITFGTHVNVICQKLALNVIEHFDYSTYENLDEFSQKVSALIEIGSKNKLFSKAIMMITQMSGSQSNPLISEQILPFKNILTKADNNKSSSNDEEDEGTVREVNEQLVEHKKMVANINLGKTEWNPDIYMLYEQLTKTIIRQNIYETKIIGNIEQYNLELQLLEEKKNKLTEQQEELIMLYNKAKKEESTMQSLLLYAAFKVREEDEEFPLVKVKGMVE